MDVGEQIKESENFLCSNDNLSSLSTKILNTPLIKAETTRQATRQALDKLDKTLDKLDKLDIVDNKTKNLSTKIKIMLCCLVNSKTMSEIKKQTDFSLDLINNTIKRDKESYFEALYDESVKKYKTSIEGNIFIDNLINDFVNKYNEKIKLEQRKEKENIRQQQANSYLTKIEMAKLSDKKEININFYDLSKFNSDFPFRAF